MTPALKPARAILPVLGLLAGLLLAPPAPAEETGLAAGATPEDVLRALEQRFAGITNVQTEFVQEKQLAILQQKVRIKGSITVKNPDKLAWHVSEPIRYGLVMAGTSLRQWDEDSGQVQQISLKGNPVFDIVIRQLRAWFSGQFRPLLADFEMRMTAAIPLTIEFAPRENSFARKAVKRVVLTFREDQRYVSEMRIEELSGDLTHMTFANTVVNGPIDPRAWEVKPDAR